MTRIAVVISFLLAVSPTMAESIQYMGTAWPKAPPPDLVKGASKKIMTFLTHQCFSGREIVTTSLLSKKNTQKFGQKIWGLWNLKDAQGQVLPCNDEDWTFYSVHELDGKMKNGSKEKVHQFCVSGNRIMVGDIYENWIFQPTPDGNC